MQGYNGAVDNTQLGEEIMTLANSYIQLDAQFSKHKNKYSVLLEKNLEHAETVAKCDRNPELVMIMSI
ncbi:Bgt-51332 [Blumeria graminis f. sp. tritici]|uniref:Bgt-51332 n=1 Tax=Blumeria graminis f. sp. tritici TaxID=62690 RepID=A0A9X9MGZ2_BLUGR|nr:Bgt-51332 [Blumeria graminis f. sp. tritici]